MLNAPTAYIPTYENDKLPNETPKEFNQRIRLETQARNEEVQANWGAPKIQYVTQYVEIEQEKQEVTDEEKEAIIAEYLAAEKARKAAERKAKAEAKASQQIS